MDLTGYYEFRHSLTDRLTADLIGPSEEDETIYDRPINRYISGILYPRRGGAISPENEIDTPDDNDEGSNADPPVAMANVRYPSSMGITFAVDSSLTGKLTVTVNASKYFPIRTIPNDIDNSNSKNEDEGTEDEITPRMSAGEEIWQRTPLKEELIEIPIHILAFGYRGLTDEGLSLYYKVRSRDDNGMVPITLALVNKNETPQNMPIDDTKAFFQSQIKVAAGDTDEAVFVSRPLPDFSYDDEEIKSYRLLYSHCHEFGTGHGCSAGWKVDPENPSRARYVYTTYNPEYDLLLTDSNPDIVSDALDIKWLAESPREEVLNELYLFCSNYENWINDQMTEAETLKEKDAGLYQTAISHLNGCKEACGRIRIGIDTLVEGNEADSDVWKAFKFMNLAMLQQRTRSVWIRKGKPEGGPQKITEHHWRPFQLAFILLCLKGMSSGDSEDRKLVDLLWFPTGGGKTEAYLGIISFTIFLRRLRQSNGGGVTALMRYTLRLLTLQQFERATLLICCCEDIRRNNHVLGDEPISIGLWVGQGATPNSRVDAAKALGKLHAGTPLQSQNPVQLHTCPWCGHPLTHRNYTMAKNPERMLVSCRSAECKFGDGLPVYLIDEDVFDYRPSLIIATIDKFAFLPWRERALELFNSGSTDGVEQLPPELIIQDELHLISGPLGTLAGLYETAVDALCSRSGISPKIIASTATIRRARQQILGLFDREVRQFPPPALDIRNSYFAVEVPGSDKGSRMYVGLMAPGASHAMLLIRTYAALMQSVFEQGAPDNIKDPYWTLVGYFNSLRVLGAARMQVEDDVKFQMTRIAVKNGKDTRAVDEYVELTSREPSSSIPSHLYRMGVSYPTTDPKPLDYLLATNMISVGVDINRLGLMVVMGQPQSTSEYIQSTSRVGRQFPGLIVVLYNAARSRDRSHYESFVSYHSTLYKQVESTSVTPFSSRARDRGLHSVFITLARMFIKELRDNSSAGRITEYTHRLGQLRDIILDRVRDVAPREAESTEKHLDEIIDKWTRMASSFDLSYQTSKATGRSLLLDASEVGYSTENGMPTLWSLRDVDKESNLYIIS